MEEWLSIIIKDYGTFGIMVVVGVIWLCNKYIKPLLTNDDKKLISASNTNDNSSKNNTVINLSNHKENNGVYSKEDLIYDVVRDLQ